MKTAVVLATYNGEKFIYDQLKSIINQTRSPDKIIVSDDGSTDNTLSICDEILKNSKCEYEIVMSDRKGVIQNFFNGISFVNEDIIFFADQDDVWDKYKIEKIMKYFESNPKCVEVLCDCYIWDGKNKPTKTMREIFGEKFPKIEKNIFQKESLWNVLVEKNIATGMCMAFKRSVLTEYKYVPKYVLHDSIINIMAASLGDIMYINEPLIYYRQHKNNTVGVKRRFNFNTIKNMKKNTYKVIEREAERLSVIFSLNSKYKFLSYDNVEKLNRLIQYSEERKKCIYNRKIWNLLKLIKTNLSMYPSVAYAIRDLLVCLLG